MRFDNLITSSCLTAQHCPTYADPRCADPAFRAANPDICGEDPGTEPCNDPAYHTTHLEECGYDDLRCQDPEFAAANPSLCLYAPRLILKPEYSVREAGGTVQYTAYLWANGVETELTEDVLFQIQDGAVAVIGAASGNATALANGITTVSATWGGLSAYAQLEVIGDCSLREAWMVMEIDNSQSSSAVFSGLNGTRLSFAKYLARELAETMDLDKDNVAAGKFNVDATTVSEFTDDEDDLPDFQAAINGISGTLLHTNLFAALTHAQTLFTAEDTSAGNRVVVLFSDGENNEGDDPVALAQTMKDSGVIIIVVGLRAHGAAFTLLNRISSGGFFINALESNEDDVLEWLSGMKGYFCSGNCEPEGGDTESRPQLNFTGFTKWDVVSGEMDLIGEGSDGYERYNFLPGNGLYVDSAGSGPVFVGHIRTKTAISFLEAVPYQLKIKVAGNQREDFSESLRVNIGELSGTLLNETITPSSYTQGFTEYTFNFTPTAFNAGTEKIEIRKASGSATHPSYGPLFDNVRLYENGVEIFSDNFDNENLQYIEPRCGAGYGNHCYAYGCLENPIEAQVPDPDPLSVIETS